MMIAATELPYTNVNSVKQIAETRISRFQSLAAFALLALSIFGFPIAALLEAIAGTGSQSITIPYRIAVVAISILILVLLPFSKSRGRLDAWLFLFLALYLMRLVYDYQTNYIPGNIVALQFYVGIVIIPLIANALGGVSRFNDQLLAKTIMFGAGSVALLASLGERLGLAYNPWEQYGRVDVRLAFEALNPISLGQVAASAMLASFIVLSNRENRKFLYLAALIIITISSILLIQAGSRGALVSVGAAIIWYGLTKFKRALIIAPLFFVVLSYGVAQTEVFEKLIGLQEGGVYQDSSALSRLDSQKVAIADFLDEPLFGKHYANPSLDDGEYPHNIIIETAMALGIVGLILWVIMLFKAGKAMIIGAASTRPMLCLLFVQKFIGTLLSGAIWGADATFMLLMLILAIDRNPLYSKTALYSGATK
jgi:O-antigen ligase